MKPATAWPASLTYDALDGIRSRTTFSFGVRTGIGSVADRPFEDARPADTLRPDDLTGVFELPEEDDPLPDDALRLDAGLLAPDVRPDVVLFVAGFARLVVVRLDVVFVAGFERLDVDAGFERLDAGVVRAVAVRDVPVLVAADTRFAVRRAPPPAADAVRATVVRAPALLAGFARPLVALPPVALPPVVLLLVVRLAIVRPVAEVLAVVLPVRTALADGVFLRDADFALVALPCAVMPNDPPAHEP